MVSLPIIMRSWVFQGRPSTFRIDDAVRELEKLTWLVKKNAGKMRDGDVVFLWRSEHNGNPAGVIAKAVLEGTIIPMFSPPEVVAYWTDPNMDNSREERVWLRILEYHTDESSMIQRNEALDDEILSKMLVIRQPTGTNYELTDMQAEVLGELWAEKQD
tara:strand:+ start:1078 stop:1554 length:477 start_codon:yes stop_codon:yes gene_type:complete